MGLSPEVRYRVCLMASTCGSAAACSRNACTLVANDSYGWWSEDVLLGDRARRCRRFVRFARLEAARPSSGTCVGYCRSGRSMLGQLEQSAEVERRRQPVHLLVGDVELAHEQVEGHVVHVLGDLQPDGRAEPAAEQFLLEGLDEVLGFVLLDLDILVPGDAEHVVLEDLHAGEQVAEVVGDEVFERDEAHLAARSPRVELHEAGQHLRHLEPRELLPCRSWSCAPGSTG